MKHPKHCSSRAAGPCDCRTVVDFPRGKGNQPPRVDRTTKRATRSPK